MYPEYRWYPQPDGEDHPSSILSMNDDEVKIEGNKEE
jgi:hypothetical protein